MSAHSRLSQTHVNLYVVCGHHIRIFSIRAPTQLIEAHASVKPLKQINGRGKNNAVRSTDAHRTRSIPFGNQDTNDAQRMITTPFTDADIYDTLKIDSNSIGEAANIAHILQF